MTEEPLCHCGRPLHYADPGTRKLVEAIVRRHGAHVVVTTGGRSFKVPRHYIALHGIMGWSVDQLGFEEVTPAIGGPAR